MGRPSTSHDPSKLRPSFPTPHPTTSALLVLRGVPSSLRSPRGQPSCRTVLTIPQCCLLEILPPLTAGASLSWHPLLGLSCWFPEQLLFCSWSYPSPGMPPTHSSTDLPHTMAPVSTCNPRTCSLSHMLGLTWLMAHGQSASTRPQRNSSPSDLAFHPCPPSFIHSTNIH